MTNAGEFEWSDEVGGPLGKEFDDFDEHYGELGRIKQITVHWGSWINAIEVEYRGEREPTPGAPPLVTLHGKKIPGLISETFPLLEGEFITKINGYFGASINSLVFSTNKGRTSRVFGSPAGGNPFPEIKSDGRFAIAIGGRADEYLRAIRFYFSKNPIESVELVDMVLNQDDSDPNTEYPEVKDNVTLINKTDNPQTLTHVFSYEKIDQVLISTGFSFAYSSKLSLGVEFIIKATLELNMNVGVTHTESSLTSVKTHAEERVEVIVPPHKQVKAKVKLKRTRFQSQWTGNSLITYASGKQETVPIENGTITGFSDGYDATVTFDPPTDIVEETS